MAGLLKATMFLVALAGLVTTLAGCGGGGGGSSSGHTSTGTTTGGNGTTTDGSPLTPGSASSFNAQDLAALLLILRQAQQTSLPTTTGTAFSPTAYHAYSGQNTYLNNSNGAFEAYQKSLSLAGSSQGFGVTNSDETQGIYASYSDVDIPSDPGARPSKTAHDAASSPYHNDQKYSDGSILKTFYSDSAQTTKIGYIAIAAPLWSGKEGQYPVLLRVQGELTLNGTQTQAAFAIIINDASGTTGKIASQVQSGGVLLRNVVTVQSSGTQQQSHTEQNGASLDAVCYQDSTGDAVAKVSLSTSGRTLLAAVAKDNSGFLTITDNSGNVYIAATWNSAGSGRATFPSGAVECFSDYQAYFSSHQTSPCS